jgi:hypothetical protein|tara:strand:+ start:38 stop:547 length:510 start_codon:yes stop_codon:yes gene_type:complete
LLLRYLICLQLFSEADARLAIEQPEPKNSPWYRLGNQRGQLIDTQVERLHLSLKNIGNYLSDQGRLPFSYRGIEHSCRDGELTQSKKDVKGYWCEVESELPLEFWLSKYEVAYALPQLEFLHWSKSIRALTGGGYLDACEAYAKLLPPVIHAKPTIEYQRPSLKQGVIV